MRNLKIYVLFGNKDYAATMYFGFVSDIVDAKWHLNMEKQNTEKG